MPEFSTWQTTASKHAKALCVSASGVLIIAFATSYFWSMTVSQSNPRLTDVHASTVFRDGFIELKFYSQHDGFLPLDLSAFATIPFATEYYPKMHGKWRLTSDSTILPRKFLGFGMGYEKYATKGWAFAASIPILLPIAVLMAWPTFDALKRRQKKSRLDTGHCQRCDYDLRGGHKDEVCPECGARSDVRPVIDSAPDCNRTSIS